MTDETEGSKPAPGSKAGDAAPTQAIPRISKAASSTPKTSAKKAPAKAPAKKAPAKSAAQKTAASAQTDKGRPRETTAAASSVKPEGVTADATKTPDSTSAKPQVAKPAGGPQGRPLTAADYARTTSGSPEATAVIPAVKGEPDDKKPAVTVTPTPGVGSGRRASLRLSHVEPWSVTRLAFTVSTALMIVAVVAAAIFWVVLNVIGVWDQINDSLTSVLSDDSSSFDVKDYFGFWRFVGLSLVLSAINVVLMTVLATIGAHLYNLAAQLMGGVEVTFSEEK